MKICLHCKHEFDTESWHCAACGFDPPFEGDFQLFAPELNNASDGFDPAAFQKLRALEERNFWFRVRNQLIVWAVGKYFTQAGSFLEIGCGTGFVLSEVESRFSTIKCAGSELQTTGLGFAKSRVVKARLLQMDARCIPFREEFDLIGAFDVLEHIKEDDVVLEQIHRAIRPGGGFLLTVPQHPSLWSHADELACHERRYTVQELTRKVTDAGFDVTMKTSFVTLLLPMMAASRLKERFLDVRADAELELPSALNSLFEGVMKFEAGLIKAGVRFPLGGSLLLAATKRARH